jgi:hypothetical protein
MFCISHDFKDLDIYRKIADICNDVSEKGRAEWPCLS